MSAGNAAVSPRTFAAGDVVLSCEPWVWSFPYRFHKARCAQCFQEAECLRGCSGCKLYRYCNTGCQTMHWEQEHKYECKMLRGIQTNILQQNRSFDHNCQVGGCSRYGCCTGEILVAKICNKILKGIKEELAGYGGKKSALDILDSLPYDEAYVEKIKLPEADLCWTQQMESIPGFEGLVRKIFYNVLPIRDQWGKLQLEMIGIFPQASYHDMSPVCWDINVTMDLRGRNLVVRATEDITNFTGAKDLRQNEWSDDNASYMSVVQRREYFRRHYQRPCTCRKCTEEYAGDLNPLKCVTNGCMERIPSDKRALEPCPQCGALNRDRLQALNQMVAKYERLYSKSWMPPVAAQINDLFLELETLNILHKDAGFRLIGGFGASVLADMEVGRYAEAWDRLSSLLASARAMYPKYHVGRARWLEQTGSLPNLWAAALTEDERQKFFLEVLPASTGYLLEARDIYRLISGEGSKWEKQVTERLDFYDQLKHMAQRELPIVRLDFSHCTPHDVIPLRVKPAAVGYYADSLTLRSILQQAQSGTPGPVSVEFPLGILYPYQVIPDIFLKPDAAKKAQGLPAKM